MACILDTRNLLEFNDFSAFNIHFQVVYRPDLYYIHTQEEIRMSSTEIKPSVDVVEQLQDPVNGNGRLRYKSYKLTAPMFRLFHSIY